MFQLGKRSRENLLTTHQELQLIIYTAIRISPIDFAVIEGHRGKKKQNQYYVEGKSKVRFPKGKHNPIPSDAFDVVPYVAGKLSWNFNHCCVLAGVILAIAANLGILLRWGGNWDMDGEPITDQDFQDLAHFERIKR